MPASTSNIIAWILQGLLALAFIASGGNKLLHAATTEQMFAGMGVPGWLGLFVGVAEVLGGVGLLVLRFTRPAAVGLIIIMLGAVFFHATKIPGGLPKGVPAIVLLVLLVVVIVLRRPAPLGVRA